MAFSKVKKELENLNKDQIITLIGELYKNNKANKEFLDHFANPDEKVLFEKFSQRIKDVFFPSRGKIDLRKGRKALTEFKKMGTSTEKNVELMFFYIETGNEAAKNFWQLDASYYNSLSSVFQEALKLLQKEEMLAEFNAKILHLINKVSSWTFRMNSNIIMENIFQNKN